MENATVLFVGMDTIIQNRADVILQTGKDCCWNCGGEIEEYINQSYKGKRGRCHSCGVDFPYE